MGNGDPGAQAQPAWELWVLGWHMATEVVLGDPKLVPIIVFTGLGPREAVASWDLEGRSSVPPAGVGMSLPSCWTHPEHTQHTRLLDRTPAQASARQSRCPWPALAMLTDLEARRQASGGRPVNRMEDCAHPSHSEGPRQ